MVDYSNDVYIWGSNSEGQFGLGHPRQVSSVVQLKALSRKAHCIASRGKQNHIITEEGSMFSWPNPEDPDSPYSPSLVRVTERSVKFSFVACGRNFAMAISRNGVLFGCGWNRYGQLGLGHTEEVKEFSPVETLRRYGEKISEVSCGPNHCICKTNTDKVFAWGNGSKGQLGTGTTKHASLPVYVKLLETASLAKARSVQASVSASFVLLDNKRVLHAGLLSRSEQMNLSFRLFDIEDKVFGGKLGPDFIPLRLYCKWSKALSLTYLMVADFRRVQVTTGIRDKIADQVHCKWEEVYNQMLPPFTEAIYKNICPKFVRKIHIAHEPASQASASHKSRMADTTLADRNKSRSRATDVPVTKSPTKPFLEQKKQSNPYNMKSPAFDKSYENLHAMRQRLERLLTTDESLWTADDRLLISTLNKT